MEDKLTSDDLYYILSELFLDRPVNFERIASEIYIFSDQEILDALFDYVAPVLYSNLWSVAGEWTFFDRDDLIKDINKLKEVRKNKGNKLITKTFYIMQRKYFECWLKDTTKDLLKEVHTKRLTNR